MTLPTLYPKVPRLKNQSKDDFFAACMVSIMDLSSGNVKYYHQNEAGMLLIFLIFPKVGMVRMTRIFNSKDADIKRFYRNTYSSLKGYNLENRENRESFFQAVRDRMRVYYEGNEVTVEGIEDILRRRFFEELKQEYSSVSGYTKAVHLTASQKRYRKIHNAPVDSNQNDPNAFLTHPPLKLEEKAFGSFEQNGAIASINPHQVDNVHTFFHRLDSSANAQCFQLEQYVDPKNVWKEP